MEKDTDKKLNTSKLVIGILKSKIDHIIARNSKVLTDNDIKEIDLATEYLSTNKIKDYINLNLPKLILNDEIVYNTRYILSALFLEIYNLLQKPAGELVQATPANLKILEERKKNNLKHEQLLLFSKNNEEDLIPPHLKNKNINLKEYDAKLCEFIDFLYLKAIDAVKNLPNDVLTPKDFYDIEYFGGQYHTYNLLKNSSIKNTKLSYKRIAVAKKDLIEFLKSDYKSRKNGAK